MKVTRSGHTASLCASVARELMEIKVSINFDVVSY